MNEKTTTKEISIWLALIPILSMIGLVVIGHFQYEIDLRFILLIAAIIAGVVASVSGVSVNRMFEEYGSTVKKAFPVILILTAIGGIVGSWMFGGTVPLLIYYGVKLLHPDFILVSTFLFTAIVSTFTGTSWGSAATAGVAFIGIGSSLGVPVEMIAGAAVSGAVFGDKVSPVSDTTNLCSIASEVTVYQHIRGMLPNVVIAGLVAAVGFIVLGIFSGQTSTIESGGSNAIITELEGVYGFNMFMLLPAAVVFIGGYKGYNPVILMVFSSLVAIVVGVFSNGFSLSDGANSLISGFSTDMISSANENAIVSPKLAGLLNKGGFEGMLKGAVLYCFLAIAFGAFMQASGALDRLMKSLLKVVKSAYGLVLSSFAAGGLLNAISGNAAFAIITTGKLFVPAFDEKNLDRTILARSMENSMTLLESLLPWHVTALYMASVFSSDEIRINPTDYLPYAFFNFAGIILFFVLARKTVRKANSTLK